MSKQSARQFLDRVETDTDFRNQLIQAPSQEAKQEIVSQANMSFTPEELEQAVYEKYQTELTPEEMKKTAATGGKGPCPTPEIMQVVATAPALENP